MKKQPDIHQNLQLLDYEELGEAVGELPWVQCTLFLILNIPHHRTYLLPINSTFDIMKFSQLTRFKSWLGYKYFFKVCCCDFTLSISTFVSVFSSAKWGSTLLTCSCGYLRKFYRFGSLDPFLSDRELQECAVSSFHRQ